MKQWTGHIFVLHMKVQSTQHSIYRTAFQIFIAMGSNYIVLAKIWKGSHKEGVNSPCEVGGAKKPVRLPFLLRKVGYQCHLRHDPFFCTFANLLILKNRQPRQKKRVFLPKEE
jgi:hypothetical protein